MLHFPHTLRSAIFLHSGPLVIKSNINTLNFNNFFEAVYWSTVLLTTVGFGDITPVTTIGRSIAICSSLFGIAIVALPSGIITAGYMKELEERRAEEEKERAAHPERGDAAPHYLNRFRLRALNSGRHEKTSTDKEEL